jgi:hypothetical protein
VFDRLREDVSLLQSEGHISASRYPLAMVWIETRIARRRMSLMMANEAVLMQAVIVSVLAGGEHLKGLLKGLQDADE